MRNLLLLFCLLVGISATAQERIPQSFSLSFGNLLTKGIQVSGHYHLNTFDELRIGYTSQHRTVRVDTISNLEDSPFISRWRWELSYIKGIRFRHGSLNNIGLYLGSGMSYGKEQISTELLEQEVIGIQFLAELDIALARKLSLFLNTRQYWLFTNHLGRNGAIGIGLRGYF